MARYIDADELISDIENSWDWLSVNEINTSTVLRQTITDIKNMPSADVQPVIHARWETGYTFPDGAYWKCTHCKTLIKVKLPMDYCNACGAKMDKENKDGSNNT